MLTMHRRDLKGCNSNPPSLPMVFCHMRHWRQNSSYPHSTYRRVYSRSRGLVVVSPEDQMHTRWLPKSPRSRYNNNFVRNRKSAHLRRLRSPGFTRLLRGTCIKEAKSSNVPHNSRWLCNDPYRTLRWRTQPKERWPESCKYNQIQPRTRRERW